MVVSGFDSKCNREVLLDFLESKRRTGGGPIKDHKQGPAADQMIVIFEDENGENFLNKSS